MSVCLSLSLSLYLRFLKNQQRGIGNNNQQQEQQEHLGGRNANAKAGLWPSVFNLATKAVISANATCGTRGREEFCKLSETIKGGGCGICDDFSSDQSKRHPINLAIDGSNRWWQSPALYYSAEYEYVTVTVDLKQIYQIVYIILKAANSPRPGAWILERSLDGERFVPWQYFARSDKECLDRFGLPSARGKPRYFTDNEVICTAFFSKLTPLENGEVHVSLIQGRPGANETSPELLEFTKAQFVRFRFVGLRGNFDPVPKWLGQDRQKDKKLFYSLKDISIGGQCVCHGHAENCRHNVASGHPECECQHHTCGPNCEKCCPLFNQKPWAPGTSRDAHKCVPCNCHGHAQSCTYDEQVDTNRTSLNINGIYQGGGVCQNCSDFTAGINCEKCLHGYYRPAGIRPADPVPCLKCDCSSTGTDVSEICIQYGTLAGVCKCKPSFAGPRCDICAPGYRGYPACESCPCDPKGTLLAGNDCERECVCKENVEGPYCDRCKPGFFGLSSQGCLACFCSGITQVCELALVKSNTIDTLKNWLITDLTVTRFITPVTSSSSVFSVGNYELPGVENLYWLAPNDYLGNKLEVYGSTFKFNVQWVVMRGDTSGEPSIGPDIIIVGTNGEYLGYGDEIYGSQKMSFEIPLKEPGWYVIPNEIKDITTSMSKRDYNKGPATRKQFLTVLSNIKHILLRGTFHTDQIEALLESATMSYGNENSNYEEGTVEKCSCYTGLSCESCSFGYVRIFANSSDKINVEGFCGKCDCNGHSQTCDPDTGECSCEHNTVGEKCERCAVGFYGNPLRGTVSDCKNCACPMENPENNFSPSCQLDYFNLNNEGGYVCTQCPQGYTGDHCEICDDGYYGDPMEIGNNCKPCDCNRGPCDRKTGQCLACKGNTEGWKCEKCKAEHYGDPISLNCKACECDPIGSLSKQCDNITGQCECKDKFIGRTCDQCEVGFGNVTALCPACSCNAIGAKSELCDTHTGICDCLPGVEGFRCDACQNLYWGFSTNGCQACNCDPNGSKYSSCDPVTGNCICRTHYEGRTCNICKAGYWKTLKKDCIKCHCNEFGALDSFCHQETGQCMCKPGVHGQNCDRCMPNYHGTVESGCIQCEPCTRKGHVCGKGGKCTCPTLTVGKECERCSINSWGFRPGVGCKACNCSHNGSATLQCDKNNGSCQCKLGYEGTRCEKCAFGYHGYPNCKKCLCHPIGTVENDCRHGLCRCNDDGTCNCKENVVGTHCAECKDGTFGLSKDNNGRGCTECFCFGRSNKCSDTKYNWDKIRFEKGIESNEPISLDTISLPKQFMGDLTNSYDGYLSINGTGGKFSVFLTGNGLSLNSDLSTNEIKLNEHFWRITSGRNLPLQCKTHLTRPCFLLVLQKVTSLIIQSQDMEIVEVLLDSAKPYIPYNRTSHSIEKCECPLEYAGLSCQDPNRGYYRYYPPPSQMSWIDETVGIAKPCECNGKSFDCDPDSGRCRNCSNHTAGSHCESCDTGYYQDISGNCQACVCPSESENNAESCVVKKHGFSCQCKKGYTGSKCESCKDSYYRDPNNNKCVPCNCNYYGSHSSICDSSGRCHCKSGFHGIKCSQCKHSREFIKDGICTPCDECTQLLFGDIDRLYKALDTVQDLFKGGLNPPWKVLDALRAKFKHYNKTINYKIDRINHIKNAVDIKSLENDVYGFTKKLDELNKDANSFLERTDNDLRSAKSSLKELKGIEEQINDIIKVLRQFGKKHIDLEGAVDKGASILEEMKSYVSDSVSQAENFNEKVSEYCHRIGNEVKNYFNRIPKLPCDDLTKFNEKLDELDLITREADDQTAVALFQNDRHKRTLNELKRIVGDVDETRHQIDDDFKEIGNKLRAINAKLGELKKIASTMEDFDTSEMQELENKLYAIEDESPNLEDLVRQASEHVSKLKKTINDRIGALNFTKDETEKIKTSGVYNEIFEGVALARQTADEANEILERALGVTQPPDYETDSLLVRTSLALAQSDRLKHRIINMGNITNSLHARIKDVDNSKETLIDNGRLNNDLIRQLQFIEDQITTKDPLVEKLYKTLDNSTRIVEKMRQIEKEVSALNISIWYDLFNQKKTYDNVRIETEVEILRANNAVNDAVSKVTHLLENNRNLDDEGVRDGQLKLDRVTSQIKELQNKILYAKQAAESVNIAIGLSNCSMLYSAPLSQTEVFRNLAVTFKCANCQLVKWTRAGLNIKVRGGKVVLDYNGKDGLLIGKDGGVKMEKTLHIQRSDSLLQMKLGNETGWKSAHIGNKAIIVDSTDVFQVGDGREGDHNPYIYKLSINDHNIGLWKFTQTYGWCKGQPRVNVKDIYGAKSFYSGSGYKKFNSTTLTPAKFNLQFYFATFDENSLIYLAQEVEHSWAFIALSLDNGHLKFDVRHNNDKTVTLKSKEKFNDGKTYSVDIVMAYSNKMQYYSLETDKNKDSTKKPLDGKAVFRIRKAIHYIGGVPPTFNVKNIDVNTRSFLGFLSHRAPLTNELISSGVTQKTGELELHKVWSNGNGSIEINVVDTRELDSLSFILRPLNANAALMDIPNFGTITLSNRLLQFNLINGEHYLASAKMALNLNDYNVIEVMFKSGTIILNVNDETETIVRTVAGYNGHFNEFVMILGSIEGFESLYGGISDIFINKKEILFTAKTVRRFSNVEIGREAPLFRPAITLKGLNTAMNISNTMQSTQSCAMSASYATHPTAVHFVNQLDSFIKIKTQFLKKDFNFEFDFRTLTSDGTLFVAIGSSHYVLLELKDGLLKFDVKGKKKVGKNWPIVFRNKVNDGEWHSVRLVKKNGKKVQMWLDSLSTKRPIRMPKTVLRNEVFLGNLPRNYVTNEFLQERIQPFEGCINNLKINEEIKLLGKNTSDVTYNNIRQCFPKIEEGAYFAGDAYAIYKEGFRINKILELSFEFRTSELNGIFLTISNENNYPALSVELQSGAVVMTVDLGNGVQSSPANNLNSDFALCNNMWHNITAVYTSSELTVYVDGVRKSWVQSAVNSLMDEIDAPLYIGGLPDNAAVGTLKTRENFKGCIRNLRIDNELKNWSEMEELNGVLLNSCPITN
ncbi:hypothetical protein ABEB36_011669 [Hypothenemus hampei]|uniref:Laminin subunit alpha-1 n=1 Tax=Hypothenemus hampei TaxID=57062 RepID=A0ABD1E8L0_HYPHA